MKHFALPSLSPLPLSLPLLLLPPSLSLLLLAAAPLKPMAASG